MKTGIIDNFLKMLQLEIRLMDEHELYYLLIEIHDILFNEIKSRRKEGTNQTKEIGR